MKHVETCFCFALRKKSVNTNTRQSVSEKASGESVGQLHQLQQELSRVDGRLFRQIENQPSKMSRCSICAEQGHNKRTCSGGGKSSSSSGDKRGSPPAEITKKEPSRTKGPSSLKNIEPILIKIDSRQKRIEENQVNVIRKLDSIPAIPYKVETVSNFCAGCHKTLSEGDKHNNCHQATKIDGTDVDSGNKKCSHCRTPGHNVKTCSKLEERKTKTKFYPGHWLPQLAQDRFMKGPTDKDGPGFIYIYAYADPKNEEDRHVWKIGMSEHENGKRRIEVQEKSNKEQYITVFHQPTPFRYLTENVIHRLLKDFRDPREHGIGRTEWFRGSREKLIRQVKDVIKEVQFAITNEYFEPTPAFA